MTPKRQRPSLRERVLRIPLFWRLMAAQVFVLSLILVLSAKLLPGRTSGVGVLLAIVAIFALGALFSGWFLHMALRPIEGLTDTARRVTSGDWSARAPDSPYADERTRRLASVLNEMLEAMALAQRTQRDLSRRVLAGEERERERQAHELYAGTAQTLAGVLVRLRIVEREIRDAPRTHGLAVISDELRSALNQTRQIARRLHPPELDQIGVRAALEAHARTITDGRRISTVFTGHANEARLNSDARLALFRIVQEAICNAVDHAQPSRIDVRFTPTERELQVEVTDDGIGFEVPRGERLVDFANLGLIGMRERAEYAHGRLRVHSQPGHGTTIGLALPLLESPVEASAGHGSFNGVAPLALGADPA